MCNYWFISVLLLNVEHAINNALIRQHAGMPSKNDWSNHIKSLGYHNTGYIRCDVDQHASEDDCKEYIKNIYDIPHIEYMAMRMLNLLHSKIIQVHII